VGVKRLVQPAGKGELSLCLGAGGLGQEKRGREEDHLRGRTSAKATSTTYRKEKREGRIGGRERK